MSMSEMKQPAYEAPALTVLGSFEDLTRGGKTGGFLDASFPVNTPFGDLTFDNDPS